MTAEDARKIQKEKPLQVIYDIITKAAEGGYNSADFSFISMRDRTILLNKGFNVRELPEITPVGRVFYRIDWIKYEDLGTPVKP